MHDSRFIARFLLSMLTAIAVAHGQERAAWWEAASPDDAAFREGLRDRGLTEWLAFHLAKTAPTDEVDAALREREALLAELDEPGVSPQSRAETIRQATSILDKLIAAHPEHAARPGWILEAARDVLERTDPMAFDAVILYELLGQPRDRVHELSVAALERLGAFEAAVAARWESLDSLDESRLDMALKSPAVGRLQTLSEQGAFLKAWARLYAAMTQPSTAGDSDDVLEALRKDIVRRRAWTNLPAGHERMRCGALLMATIVTRHLRRFDDAEHFALGIIDTMKLIQDPAELQRLERVGLLSILEQIRIHRDRGDHEKALAALRGAQAWLSNRRGDDVTPTLAAAFAERHLFAARDAPRDAVVRTLLKPTEALAPLKEFAAASPARRDLLYRMLAGALRHESSSGHEDTFVVQLLAGTALEAGLAVDSALPPNVLQRCTAASQSIDEALSNRSIRMPPALRGELLYLFGRLHVLLGDQPRCIAQLVALGEQYPDHDRTPEAVALAAGYAQDYLHSRPDADAARARRLFIQAARLFMTVHDDTLEARLLQYQLALSLEQDESFAEAAELYALVTSDAPRFLDACLGQVRCHQQMATEATEDAQRLTHIELAIEASHRGIASGRERDSCAWAALVVARAHLLNHSLVNRPADALTTLAAAEVDADACSQAVGGMLRERIRALQALDRLSDAREVIGSFLQRNPDDAGPAMAMLLQRMRAEIDEAADQGDPARVKELATEAAALARQLEDWAGEHAGRMGDADLLTIRIWRGASLLQADEPEAALELLQACQQELRAQSDDADDARMIETALGCGEALLRLRRPAEALPIFSEIWQRTAERSPAWWRAYCGSLQAHTMQGDSAPEDILASIRQQKVLAPGLGGARWKSCLEQVEQVNRSRLTPPSEDTLARP